MANENSGASHAGHVDRICDEFEARWRDGGRPRLEDFLTAAPTDLHESLFAELLALDIELRSDDGPTPSREDYLQRFPERALVIDRVWPGSRHTAEPSGVGVAMPVSLDQFGKTVVASG